MARHKIETTGEASRLQLQADRPQWKADGMDLQYVRIAAVDKKGRQVPSASEKLHFSVEGPAEIVGVVNGDITSDELTVGDTRSLYRGTATVILRSKRDMPGKVTLTVTGEQMKRQTLQLVTQ